MASGVLLLAGASRVSWGQFHGNLCNLFTMAVLWVLVALCSSASTVCRPRRHLSASQPSAFCFRSAVLSRDRPQSFLGVALIDVVKAFAPLLTMLLSMLFERDEQGMPLRYSCKVFASVCVVVVGTIMAVYDLSQSSPLGYFLASVATISVCCSAQPLITRERRLRRPSQRRPRRPACRPLW
jgi:hypothetical protein